MNELAILIPVLRRPQNILPLVKSIERNTAESFEIVFIASAGDKTEIDELKNQKQEYIILDNNSKNKGDYAKKINKGFYSIKAEWYFLGADDLKFHPGWFRAAMKVQQKSSACVVGTNDMGNVLVKAGQHSTHSLVRRDYVLDCGTIDEPGKVLHEGYIHNFVDMEFVNTAQWRGAWDFAKNSFVEHLHPDWGKGQRDSVYNLGKSGWETDRQYFQNRKKLWP